MKAKYTLMEILLMILVSLSLFSQDYNYLSDYDGQGVPLDMVNTSVSLSLIDNINASLPENYPVPDYNPQYITADTETEVILTEVADVWVTFIGEGAGYKNVLGFYTYDLFDPPSGPPADEDVTIIFPNVSAAGSGGGLIVGDKVYLGQFPANTGIGWVLIANGWNGSNVTYGNWVLYSNPFWNPEGSSDLQKHNVNLFDNNEQVVVFGFEDIRRDFGSCDQDFNDALFLVTSNPYTAIQTDNYNQITYDGGGQSSGGDGGLESNRGLSSKIAQRTYNRTKNGNPIQEANTISLRSKSELEQYVPLSIKENDQMVISSPTDLESITKADEVWSADFLKDGEIFASVFSTMTNDGVYDHTKVVCDRLAGAKIVDIQNIMISNHKLLMTTLEREDGNLEYSISVSVEIINQEKSVVFSNWAVDQYPENGKFLNYQIWSSAPFLSRAITQQILSNINNEMETVPNESFVSMKPDVFIQSGRYINNTIEYEINNTTKEEVLVRISGTTTTNELDDSPDPYLEHIVVPPGVHPVTYHNRGESLFDVELRIGQIGADNYDVVYFSDGAWAMDFEDDKTNVSTVSITPSMYEPEDFEYLITRNISVDYTSTDYVTIYKNLRPSGSSIDLSDFNGIKANIKGEGLLELKLVKSSIDSWDDQFYYTIELTEDVNEVEIPFSYFRNRLNAQLSTEDLKLITFTQKNQTGNPNTLAISNLRFVQLESDYLAKGDEDELSIFPNPSNGVSELIFESQIEIDGYIRVYNQLGTQILQQRINILKGLNIKDLDLASLPKGAYWVEVVGANVLPMTKNIIVF